jgi:hypothetical protein
MNLNYHISKGKITYGYESNEIKYQTSLKPTNINWSEWRKLNNNLLKNYVIKKTWDDILTENISIEKTGLAGILGFNNPIINKLIIPFYLTG